MPRKTMRDVVCLPGVTGVRTGTAIGWSVSGALCP